MFSVGSSPNLLSSRQLSGVWAQRAEVLRPPLEGRDVVEYPPPNLSVTSDYSIEQLQFDRMISFDAPPTGHVIRSPSGGSGSRPPSSNNRHIHYGNNPVPAKRSLSDHMNQAAITSNHPLPPPQFHSGGYYSQSSSTSSQGSYRGGGAGGGGQQLQGAWATPGKSGAAVVKSGSPSRNLSSGASCGSASPLFNLSRRSSISSHSSGSVTPASSGTRTPVASHSGVRGGGAAYAALISSSASKLEKIKRETATSPQRQQQGRGGGHPLKHSVSGPTLPDSRRRRSQQFIEREFRDSNRTPRRNVSSQNFQHMRSLAPPDRPLRPLSDSFGTGAPRENIDGEIPRSYSESRSPRDRRTNQPATKGRGRGGRGRGHTRK